MRRSLAGPVSGDVEAVVVLSSGRHRMDEAAVQSPRAPESNAGQIGPMEATQLASPVDQRLKRGDDRSPFVPVADPAGSATGQPHSRPRTGVDQARSNGAPGRSELQGWPSLVPSRPLGPAVMGGWVPEGSVSGGPSKNALAGNARAKLVDQYGSRTLVSSRSWSADPEDRDVDQWDADEWQDDWDAERQVEAGTADAFNVDSSVDSGPRVDSDVLASVTDLASPARDIARTGHTVKEAPGPGPIRPACGVGESAAERMSPMSGREGNAQHDVEWDDDAGGGGEPGQGLGSRNAGAQHPPGRVVAVGGADEPVQNPGTPDAGARWRAGRDDDWHLRTLP